MTVWPARRLVALVICSAAAAGCDNGRAADRPHPVAAPPPPVARSAKPASQPGARPQLRRPPYHPTPEDEGAARRALGRFIADVRAAVADFDPATGRFAESDAARVDERFDRPTLNFTPIVQRAATTQQWRNVLRAFARRYGRLTEESEPSVSGLPAYDAPIRVALRATVLVPAERVDPPPAPVAPPPREGGAPNDAAPAASPSPDQGGPPAAVADGGAPDTAPASARPADEGGSPTPGVETAPAPSPGAERGPAAEEVVALDLECDVTPVGRGARINRLVVRRRPAATGESDRPSAGPIAGASGASAGETGQGGGGASAGASAPKSSAGFTLLEIDAGCVQYSDLHDGRWLYLNHRERGTGIYDLDGRPVRVLQPPPGGAEGSESGADLPRDF